MSDAVFTFQLVGLKCAKCNGPNIELKFGDDGHYCTIRCLACAAGQRARPEAAPAPAPDAEDAIEVTPEMIEAGVQASCLFDSRDNASWMVDAVYRAMTMAKREAAG